MSEEKMLRHDKGKPNWTLIHYETILPFVEGMMYGATRYPIDNWKLPPENPRQPLESAMRHLTSLVDGEEIDPESGVRHAGFVMTNMMIYLYHNKLKE